MNRLRIIGVFGLGLGLLLSSCGGSTSENTADTIRAVDTSAVNKDEGEPSLDVAARQYSEIVRPTNCALMEYTSLEEKYRMEDGQVDLSGIEELTAAVGRVSSTRQIAVENLVKTDWPTEVAQDMEALALFWTTLQRAERDVSAATDQGSWNSAVNNWVSTSKGTESGRSKIIRIKLGLGDFQASECE